MRKKTNIHFPSRPISSQHFPSSNSPKPWHSPNKKFVNQNVVPNQKRVAKLRYDQSQFVSNPDSLIRRGGNADSSQSE